MFDLTVYMSPEPVRINSQGIINNDKGIQKFQVIHDGNRIKFPECPEGNLEIPEDYYIYVQLKYLYDDDSEFYNYSPQIIINDETYYCEYIAETGVWQVSWNNVHQMPHSGRPFFGLAGRHEIRINAGSDYSYSYYVYIDVLASLDIARDIKGMLQSVNENYDEISAMCFNTNMQKDSSLIELIDAADNVLKVFKSKWNILIPRLRRTLEPELDVIPNGVPNSPEAVHWLCHNPDALGYCRPEEQNFAVNNIPVRTDFAAQDVVRPQYKLFENLVIAGFFDNIESKLGDLRRFITEHRTIKENAEPTLFPGYIRYSRIVEEYSIDILSQHEKQIQRIQDEFLQLRNNFRRITGITGRVVPRFPKFTPFVTRTPVYGDLFRCIFDWYQDSHRNITLNDFAMHFIKIDKLFEFTTLSKITDAVNDLGFSLISSEWHDMSQGHFGGIAGKRPDNEPFNYYSWQNHDQSTRLELWYEPRIRTIDEADDNELVVVRGSFCSSSYYRTPDFVFRVSWLGFEDLLIMDAKYSSDNTVVRNSLPSLIEKYLYSFNIKNRVPTGNHIQAIWALYSRGTRQSISGYTAQHNLDSEYSVLPSLGGVRMDFKNSDVFRQKFGILLTRLKAMHQGEIAAFIHSAAASAAAMAISKKVEAGTGTVNDSTAVPASI